MEVRMILILVQMCTSCTPHKNSGNKIRVFLCGDYEFETRCYGLSGASGMLNTCSIFK